MDPNEPIDWSNSTFAVATTSEPMGTIAELVEAPQLSHSIPPSPPALALPVEETELEDLPQEQA